MVVLCVCGGQRKGKVKALGRGGRHAATSWFHTLDVTFILASSENRFLALIYAVRDIASGAKLTGYPIVKICPH